MGKALHAWTLAVQDQVKNAWLGDAGEQEDARLLKRNMHRQHLA